jgi:hypothetical protein
VQAPRSSSPCPLHLLVPPSTLPSTTNTTAFPSSLVKQTSSQPVVIDRSTAQTIWNESSPPLNRKNSPKIGQIPGKSHRRPTLPAFFYLATTPLSSTNTTLAGVAQSVERVALITAKRSTSRSWVRAPPSAIPIIQAHQSGCSFALLLKGEAGWSAAWLVFFAAWEALLVVGCGVVGLVDFAFCSQGMAGAERRRPRFESLNGVYDRLSLQTYDPMLMFTSRCSVVASHRGVYGLIQRVPWVQ